MKMIGISPRFASLLAVSAILAGSSLNAAETGKAELTGIKGSVKVDGQAASVGDAVKPGQSISTGAGAQANLYLGDNGPTVVVLPDSSVSFDELSVDKSGAETVITTKINLKVGTVAGYVKKTSSQSSYIVKGPTVSAVIRTSEYQITDNGTVAVWSGCVTVSYRGVSYEVCGGQMFDPAAASVVANTLPIIAPMPSSARQSLSAKVPAPTVATRPEPLPADTARMVVLTKDVISGGKVVYPAGTPLLKYDYVKAVATYGSANVSGIELPLPNERPRTVVVSSDVISGGEVVILAGTVLMQDDFNKAVATYGSKNVSGVPLDNSVRPLVVSSDVISGDKVVILAGTVLTPAEFNKAVDTYGREKVSGIPVSTKGLIVITDPLQIPELTVNQIFDLSNLEEAKAYSELVQKYGDKAFGAVKVVPAVQVTPEGIVPKKPEVVASPSTP